jgi:hypothetical protein
MGVLGPLICRVSPRPRFRLRNFERCRVRFATRKWDRQNWGPSRPGPRCGAVPCDLGLCASRRDGCKRTRLAETASCTSSRAIDGRGYDKPSGGRVTPAPTAALPDGTVVGIEGPCGRLDGAYELEMGREELLEGAT